MGRIHFNRHYSDTKAEKAEYKAAKNGGLEDEFWDEDELVDHRPSSKSKKRYPRGCKGNNGGPHVYVWVPWDWGFTPATFEEQRCAGCDRRGRFRRIN